MAAAGAADEQVRTIGETAEVLWDASRRFQDLLDELEQERLGRWAAYAAFRDVGASFRSALERLRVQEPSVALVEVTAAYQAGARAGLEAAADLADGLRYPVTDGGIEAIELGIQRLTLASQHFVRGRHLLQQYLDWSGAE